MRISQQVFNINQLTVEEYQALELAEKIFEHIQDAYGEKCRLTSVNDGECVTLSEIPRVRGIIDFVMRNRVVEVDVA
jgi:ribosome biogenesis GTPase A